MRKLVLVPALCGLLVVALSVDVAGAQVQGPDEYDGHRYGSCEAPTHLSYYDPRNEGQTVFDTDDPNGDNIVYADTDPLAGFQPDGNYSAEDGPNHDCDGTPVLHTTAYFAVTFSDQDGTERVGYPACPRPWTDDRNPSCEDTHTGISGAVYVGNGDQSIEEGRSFGVTPFHNGD